MKLIASQTARLEFLIRVTERECVHLLIQTDQVLAERLDAFVSRFGRLQDTVWDKLIPALLAALGENLAVLTSALRNGHGFVPTLVTTARRCAAEAQRLLLRP